MYKWIARLRSTMEYMWGFISKAKKLLVIGDPIFIQSKVTFGQKTDRATMSKVQH